MSDTKRLLFGFVLGALVVGLMWFVLSELSDAIYSGLCKRQAADLRSIANALERYRTDHGTYPLGMTIEDAAAALEPQYQRIIPKDGIDYFSNGSTFALTATWGPDGPSNCRCCFEMRNGEFVVWPAFMGDSPPGG